MGAGAGVIEELDNNPNFRMLLDLTDMSQWRFIARIADNDGTAICRIGVQYSTDDFGTWRGLDNGKAGTLNTASHPCAVAGWEVTAWTDLNDTAQADVWLRIAGIDDGAASTDVQFGTIQVQFRG